MKRRTIAWGRGRPARRLVGHAALLALGLMLACAKKEPEPDCGCESKDIGFLPETNAEYGGNGLFEVYNVNANTMSRFYTVCDYDPSWKLSERGNYDYRISGYYKSQCLIPPNRTIFVTNNPLGISSIVVPK